MVHFQTPLVFPEWAKHNMCLPRDTRPGKLSGVPLLEDRVDVITQDKWDQYIGEINLRSRVHEILYQGRVGSCATESTTQADLVVADRQGLPFVRLNPWSIYAETSDGRDNGSMIDRNVEFAQTRGILPLELWSRNEGWNAKAPNYYWEKVGKLHRLHEVYDCNTTDETGTALIRGYPVIFGWKGHSCVLLQLVDRYRALYANSWGKDWEDNGFGIISLASINYRYGAFAVRSVYDFQKYDLQTVLAA